MIHRFSGINNNINQLEQTWKHVTSTPSLNVFLPDQLAMLTATVSKMKSLKLVTRLVDGVSWR